MPVPAFVPLIMVWVGIEESAKITVIFIGTFFQLVLMVADIFGQRRTGSCKYRTWIHNLKIAAFLKDGRYFCQHYFDRSAWTDYGPYFCIFK